MSLLLPVWRRDVKGLRAAWEMSRALGTGNHPTAARREPTGAARRGSFAFGALLVLAAGSATARPAVAIEPGHAFYAGGTAGIAEDTAGSVEDTSATDLIFRYKTAAGTAGLAIPYATIRTFELRNDVVRHLGFLPALGAGLVTARQRRYTLAIGYTDVSGAAQVAILQVAERDQHALEAILRTRSPKACMLTEYVRSCPVVRRIPAATAPAAPALTSATGGEASANAPPEAVTEVPLGKPPAVK